MTSLYATIAGGVALGFGAAAAGYAAIVARHRAGYGRTIPPAGPAGCGLLDRFIPAPEVVEHHHIRIAAPADVVLGVAKAMPLLDAPMVRALIRIREIALGGAPDRRPHPPGLLAQMRSIGWVVLAERAGRELVAGAVTIPWHAHPVFRSVPAPEFAAFREPGYVKIAWSLRVDPIDAAHSVFHTETRVRTTDEPTRAHFRRYWSFVAPGVGLIRFAMLRPLKREAERRAAIRAA